MRDLEAEDRLFKKAAREVHEGGVAWFSLLDVAAQIAIENKKINNGRSIGGRVLKFFGMGHGPADAAVTINDGLYTIAGRLTSEGSLEARREVEGPEAEPHLYRLVEETLEQEAVAA